MSTSGPASSSLEPHAERRRVVVGRSWLVRRTRRTPTIPRRPPGADRVRTTAATSSSRRETTWRGVENPRAQKRLHPIVSLPICILVDIHMPHDEKASGGVPAAQKQLVAHSALPGGSGAARLRHHAG